MQRLTSLLALLTFVNLTAAPAPAQWSTQFLSQARRGPAAVSAGGLAFFAGGEITGASSAVLDIYVDANDTWSTDALSSARNLVAAAAIGNFVLFAGGALSSSTQSNVVDVFDLQTMTWSTPHTLSQARLFASATTVGSKVIFAGGATGTYQSPVLSDVVDIYDASKGLPSNPSAWSTTTLPSGVARLGIAALTVGDLALFAGGGTGVGGSFDTIDVYDDSTGLWSTASLTEKRFGMGAAVVGTRAYFGGGSGGGGVATGIVEIYDASIGVPSNSLAWSTMMLPHPRFQLGAAAVGSLVLFAGGLESGFVISDMVDILNTGTGQWSSSANLSQARADMGATTVGGKALFAGGTSGFGSPHAEVDMYEPMGPNYCVATTNSTGCAASIDASGSPSLAANDLVLSSSCMPNGVFLFFHAANQVQIPFGDGFLCAGGNVIRILPAGVASGGLAQAIVDLPSASITSPGLRNFQCWYRDPAAGASGFNLSDAIAITFVP